MRVKTWVVFLLSGLVFLAACTPNNVKEDANIAPILEKAGLKGSFALLENGTETFIIHNLTDYKDFAKAPLNSFFIVPTLIAIDKGLIHKDPATWIPLDSSKAYIYLMQQIGRKDLLQSIDSLHYGKGQISADSSNFWDNQSLKITADEQLGLIKKLYFNQLYFQKRSQDLFKKMIIKEDNANYTLSYINATDTATKSAWILGYIEENKHPYFFVLSTSAKTAENLALVQINTLKAILSTQGFFKGTR